jgi:hypothetical protein
MSTREQLQERLAQAERNYYQALRSGRNSDVEHDAYYAALRAYDESRGLNINPEPSIPAGDLNELLRTWFQENEEELTNLSPDNRIESFINFVRNHIDNEDRFTRIQRSIRQYANQSIPALFSGGGKYKRNRRNSKKRRRNSKKRLGGKKHSKKTIRRKRNYKK